jgi:hypothetical protein
VKPGFENDSWTLYLEKIQHPGLGKFSEQFNDVEKAPWAASMSGNIRRGVDQPFARRSDETAVERPESLALPPLPLRVEPKEKPAGSRFIERFRESQLLSRGASPFASHIQDHDQPIPLPRLSQWISAESLKG